MTKRTIILLIIIIVINLALKTTNFISLNNNDPFFHKPFVDEAYHHYVTKTIVEEGLSSYQLPYYRAPLYIYTLSLVYKVFGATPLNARVFNHILGLFVIILIFLITRELWNDISAFISSLIVSLYPITFYIDNLIHTSNLELLFYLLGFLFIIKALKTNKYLWWITGSISLGLSAITRPTILPFLLFLFLFLIIFYKQSWREKLKVLAIFASGIIIIIAPITLLNLFVGDDLVIIAWTGGVNFYLGNNEDATGMTVSSSEIGTGIKEQFTTAVDIPEEELSRKLKKSEISDYWFNKGLLFIRENPIKWGKLLLMKTVLIWNNQEVGNNYNITGFSQFTPLMRLHFPNFAFIFAFGIIGFILSKKNIPNFYFPLLFVSIYSVTLIFIFVNTRYRIPVTILLSIFSGYGIYALFKEIKNRDVYKTIILFSLILFLSIFSIHNFYSIKEKASNLSIFYYNIGDLYFNQNNPEKTIEYFEKALREEYKTEDLHLTLLNRLGFLYKQSGEMEKASYCFNASLDIRPSTYTYNELALIHIERGNLKSAEILLQKALHLDPTNPISHHYLGLLEMYRKNYEGAIELMTIALDTNPPVNISNNIHYNLAVSYLSLGDKENALSHLNKIKGEYEDKAVLIENISK